MNMTDNKKEAIVLVHGLWMKGPELLYIYYKLWRQGYRIYSFRYPSIFKTAEENATKLSQFVSNIDAPVIHFVAHSLGGLVVNHLLQKDDINKIGKVVLIGSPVNGSGVAKKLSQNKFLKCLLGKSIVKGLFGDVPVWSDKRKTCVIAGIKGLGAGHILAHYEMQKPNDGTVNLNETKIEKVDESHEIPRSHFMLLFSNEVVKIIVQFLKKQ
jgi:triacylglycerol esterase/lipase EstA (alpha/beta hydrolase family)